MANNQTNHDFASPIFTVIAGALHKTFYAHADVLFKAEKFRAIVDGDWKESHERVIDLNEWDEEIVSQLLEYLYTEDYQCPLPLPDIPHAPDGEQSASIQSAGDGKTVQSASKSYNLRSKGKADSETSRTKPQQTFLSSAQTRRKNILDHTVLVLEKDLSNSSAHHDRFLKHVESSAFDPDLHSLFLPMMFHATLYVLADFIFLPDLQNLALFRLMHLMNLGTNDGFLGPERSVAMVEVAKFVYANSVPNSDRWVVSEFVALKLDILDQAVVAGLVEEGGDVLFDVLKHVREGMGGTWDVEKRL